MVRITEELVRKRCEHNEGQIGSLEEISLHQENIEKIEHLQNWCRDLKILLFHSNLISKIENVNKLKKLEYLNLSLNNVERIENLEGCEFLQKLDLTLNFVGELTSVENLVHNIHLHTVYLTGNPCTDYPDYREFVVATLPQLKNLDGEHIERSERIVALRNHDQNRQKILVEQEKYAEFRRIQKAENELKYRTLQELALSEDIEDVQKFWNEPSDNSPETRVFIAEQMKKRENRVTPEKNLKPKRVYNLFKKDGQPRNVNEAQVPFTLKESEDGSCFILDVAVYRYLESSLVEADVQPTYVLVRIKGKALQLVLQGEVKTDSSTAQRSQTTGHLIITMPKVNPVLRPVRRKEEQPKEVEKKQTVRSTALSSKRELLEIGPPSTEMDFSRIVERNYEADMKSKNSHCVAEKQPSPDFVENPEVPPLES